MKEKRNIIGPRLNALRCSAGLSCEEVARRVAQQGGSITAEQIRRIEARDRRVKDDEVLLLSHALGVVPDELFDNQKR